MQLSPITPTPLTSANAKPRFAHKIPWDVRLAQNQLANRVVMDFLGSYPWLLAFARNHSERLEKTFVFSTYLALGIGMPLLLGKIFNAAYVPKLIKQFGLAKNATPLNLPFEYLAKNGLKHANPKLLAQNGIQSLEKLTPTLIKKITHAKLAIVWMDLFFLGLKGILGTYGRNWLTERLSKKKGFSGTFNYTTEAYREKKSANYEKNKEKRLWLNFAIAFGSAFALPLLVKKGLNSSATSGIVGKIKKVLPMVNYSNTIFMSKWVLMWATITNRNVPHILFSRDSHEFRESMIRDISFDFFYFMGDDYFGGMFAKAAQKKHEAALKGEKLYKVQKRFGIMTPVARPYHKVFFELGENSKNPAFKLARGIFWKGFLLTTACLSITTPIINIWLTKKKVTQEQAKMIAQGELPPQAVQQAPKAQPASSNQAMPALSTYTIPSPQPAPIPYNPYGQQQPWPNPQPIVSY